MIQVTLDAVGGNDPSRILHSVTSSTIADLHQQVNNANTRASNVLLNNLQGKILNGSRNGLSYKRGSSFHIASAPGESPAVDSGNFRQSWGTRTAVTTQSGNLYTVESGVESGWKVGNHFLGELLENGTSRMAPRPYKEKALTQSMPEIESIFNGLS